MTDIGVAVMMVVGLFVVLLAVKRWSRWTFCVLCGGVTGAWAVLLALSWGGRSIDPVVTATLLGGSAVGLFYLIEQHLPRDGLVFRLPILLTLILVAYGLVRPSPDVLPAALVVGGVWGVAIFIAVLGRRRWRMIIDALIDCCRRW